MLSWYDNLSVVALSSSMKPRNENIPTEMNKIRRVVNNTLISLFGQVVTWSSTLLLTIAYGRYLGDVKFGELFLAITFVSLIGIPVEQGFNQQLTRDVAKNPEKAQAYLWNTLLIKAMLWMPLYGAILLFSWLLGYGQEQRAIVAICGITLMSGSTVNTFASLHYAFERTVFPAVGMILEKGLTALVGIILLIHGATVQVMAFVLLGGSMIDAIWVSVWFFRLEGWHASINKVIARNLLHGCIPFILYGVLGIIYYRIDTILLSLMTHRRGGWLVWRGIPSFRYTLLHPKHHCECCNVPGLFETFCQFPIKSESGRRKMPESPTDVRSAHSYVICHCGA